MDVQVGYLPKKYVPHRIKTDNVNMTLVRIEIAILKRVKFRLVFLTFNLKMCRTFGMLLSFRWFFFKN